MDTISEIMPRVWKEHSFGVIQSFDNEELCFSKSVSLKKEEICEGCHRQNCHTELFSVFRPLLICQPDPVVLIFHSFLSRCQTILDQGLLLVDIPQFQNIHTMSGKLKFKASLCEVMFWVEVGARSLKKHAEESASIQKYGSGKNWSFAILFWYTVKMFGRKIFQQLTLE